MHICIRTLAGPHEETVIDINFVFDDYDTSDRTANTDKNLGAVIHLGPSPYQGEIPSNAISEKVQKWLVSDGLQLGQK